LNIFIPKKEYQEVFYNFFTIVFLLLFVL